MKASDEDLLRFLDTRPTGPLGRADQSHGGIEQDDSACFGPDVYLRLVIGVTSKDEASQALAHAASCDGCGELLLRSLEAMEGNESPEEVAAVQELASRRGWQTVMASQLAASKLPAGKPALWINRLGLKNIGRTAGVAAGLIGAVTLFVWQKHNSDPARQLAMAYSQARTLDLRIPYADQSPLSASQHTRGSAGNTEPAALLDARARLARELQRSPQDSHWLELQARADLLDERYDDSIDTLDRLIAQGSATAELYAGAAAAYYQRGLASNSELDRSRALDDLRHADQLAPTDPVILFDEAIVMEDRGQVMNAVEVWNRFLTIEHDPKWAAEGKQRLAALEASLNRFKTHQSRISNMLNDPASAETLAGDPVKLAALDEELMTYELDALLPVAYPVGSSDANQSVGAPMNQGGTFELEQARGSPCDRKCQSSRTLLKAIAASLVTVHQDFWLADLLPPQFEKLSPSAAIAYARALQLLGHAIRDNLSGLAVEAAKQSQQSQALFRQLHTAPVSRSLSALSASSRESDRAIRVAAKIGEDRAAVEYLFALQRQVDFADCRVFAKRLDSSSQLDQKRYPWVFAVKLITEKVCDDTPETLAAGDSLLRNAAEVAKTHNYRLLAMRIQMRQEGDAQDAGDQETAQRLTLATFREIFATDAPPIRVASTIDQLPYSEYSSSRNYAKEVYLRETVRWFELLGNRADSVQARMELARAEMRIGEIKEAKKQLELAYAEDSAGAADRGPHSNFSESVILLADFYLEHGDLAQSQHYLDQAATYLTRYSDLWGLRTYAVARGQLDLAQGRFDEAAKALETEIRSNEGNQTSANDKATNAQYAQLDHDLYAELAATWLMQHKDPERILALWERFRVRSRGLPTAQCGNSSLDCDLPALVAAQQKLGSSIVTGQVVLLDRVLVYTMDKGGVRWEMKMKQRLQILDAADRLDRAVSSPLTSFDSASDLGQSLGSALLPKLPANLASDASLLLEPDPLLNNLCWPVLPTSAGPLGIVYPVSDLRSILLAWSEPQQPEKSGKGLRSGEKQFNARETLVVGASVAADGAPPLPEAIAEARSVERFLRVPQSTPAPQLLLGAQANTEAIGDALGSATIFHFAGHAVRAKDGTQLLLAKSSTRDTAPWLDAAFLRAHPPRACKLAVLSACATGSLNTSWTDPLQDIVETLDQMGVAEVVATRWQIDSQAAVPFMDSFYAGLAQGDTAAGALRSARRLQSANPIYRHPYYWGAYYANGRETEHFQGELHASFRQEAKERRR